MHQSTEALRPDVSIVIPAYNEARRLPATLAGWREFLEAHAFTWEIIVVDDGSRDSTAAVAREAGATRVIRLAANQGKGGAVKCGVLAAAGHAVAYVDADLNVTPDHLLQALALLDGTADLVAGQRDLAEYAAAEGPARLLAGGLVQVTRRTLVMASIRDTQCGFKVFTAELARAVFSRTRIRSFAFDIEVLFIAAKLGARIVELPVRTTFRAESTFSVRKHLPRLLHDVVQVRLNDLAGQYSR